MNCKFCGHLIPTLDDPYPKPIVFCDDDCLHEYVLMQVGLYGGR